MEGKIKIKKNWENDWEEISSPQWIVTNDDSCINNAQEYRKVCGANFNIRSLDRGIQAVAQYRGSEPHVPPSRYKRRADRPREETC